MCGIAGIFGDLDPDREGLIGRMLGTMARRGPDDSGILEYSAAISGNRHEAIMDRSRLGHQRMRLDDGTTISFNGAIYNFVELRSELDQRGNAFQSRSDTEVVLRGYQEWGIVGLVSKLRGMYAFAIWDESRNRGYLVRDRRGVNPLMFVRRERSIAFASTVEALRAGGLVGGLEMSAVADFLAHGYISEGDAIFEGVKKLPPATIAEWSLGSGLCERTYWSIPGAEPA